MSYLHLPGETNQDREKRLAAEYEAYVRDLKAQSLEPTNYPNWLASKKHTEKQCSISAPAALTAKPQLTA